MDVVQEYEKRDRLKVLLERVMDGSKLLIFTDTKRGADDLTRTLRYIWFLKLPFIFVNFRMDGWPALCIHGDKKQEERDWVVYCCCW